MNKQCFAFVLWKPEQQETYTFMINDLKTYDEAMEFVNESYLYPHGWEVLQMYSYTNRTEAQTDFNDLVMKARYMKKIQ